MVELGDKKAFGARDLTNMDSECDRTEDTTITCLGHPEEAGCQPHSPTGEVGCLVRVEALMVKSIMRAHARTKASMRDLEERICDGWSRVRARIRNITATQTFEEAGRLSNLGG